MAAGSSLESNGLSATLHAGAASVAMGDWIEFRATVALDTTRAPSNVRMFNRVTGKCELVFADSKGKTFRRSPYDVGMPRMEQPGDVVRMKDRDPVDLEEVRVYLLSGKGEQIPPGTYSVHMVYSQAASAKTEAYIDANGQYQRRTYSGPYEFWTGQLDSEPCTIKILPASPAPVEVEVPTAMLVDTTTISHPGGPPGITRLPPRLQIAWQCDPKSTQVVRVMKRPGYAIGQKWTLETWVDGKMISDYPRGLGALLAGGRNLFHPDMTAQVLNAKRAEFVLHMEIFETSAQDVHLWQPEDGDYKTLWKGDVRQCFSVSK